MGRFPVRVQRTEQSGPPPPPRDYLSWPRRPSRREAGGRGSERSRRQEGNFTVKERPRDLRADPLPKLVYGGRKFELPPKVTHHTSEVCLCPLVSLGTPSGSLGSPVERVGSWVGSLRLTHRRLLGGAHRQAISSGCGGRDYDSEASN